MINKKLLIATGAAAITAGMYSSCLTAASVTADAAANVITPISISQVGGGLNFGDVSVGVAGGTVTLPEDGSARSATGDAEAVLGGANAPGVYQIIGEPNKAYTLSFPGAAVDISGGVGTMDVDNFSDDSSGTIPGAGTENFNVGARLTIGASQAANLYTGTYTLTVNYQ